MNRPVRRRALLLGIENYADNRFAPLPSIRADLSLLGQALLHRHIGAFTEVRPVIDCTAERMCTEIAEFLGSCEEDELALLYISGHGTRLVQVNSEFHFVTADTERPSGCLLTAYAVGSDGMSDRRRVVRLAAIAGRRVSARTTIRRMPDDETDRSAG